MIRSGVESDDEMTIVSMGSPVFETMGRGTAGGVAVLTRLRFALMAFLNSGEGVSGLGGVWVRFAGRWRGRIISWCAGPGIC